MKNQVTTLLNKEAALEAQLKQVAVEKEQLAINVLADADVLVRELGCEHLLNTNTESTTVVENIVNVSINKGRIVEVVKEVEAKATANITINKGKIVKIVKDRVQVIEDNTKIEELVFANKDLTDELAKKEAMIQDLAEQVARFKKSSSSFQSRATKAENEVAKLNTVIAELQAQLAETTKPMTTTNEVVEETGFNDDYLLYLATQEESIMAQFNEEQEEVVENTIETKKEVKEEIKKEVTNKANGPEYVKLVSAKLGKSEHVKLFLTESCYLIASPFAQEMTWITNGPISDEYKMQVEEILVKDYKFNKSRVEVSPIVVSDSVGYMARVKGAEGTNVYSNDDVYSGYVKYKGEFILYTYFPNTNTAIIESLDKKILESQGKLSGSTMPKDKKALQFVNGKIRNMFKKYEALTADIRKEHAESVKKANDNFNAKAEEANRILEARRAKIMAAAANDPTIAAELNRMEGGTNREEVTTVVDDNEPLLDSSIDTNEFDSVLNEFGGF